MSGTVTDEQGAVVADAAITITDTAKSFERTATTNGEGVFIFTSVAPSNYSVKASKNGFAGTQIPNVVLNVNDQSSIKNRVESRDGDGNRDD